MEGRVMRVVGQAVAGRGNCGLGCERTWRINGGLSRGDEWRRRDEWVLRECASDGAAWMRGAGELGAGSVDHIHTSSNVAAASSSTKWVCSHQARHDKITAHRCQDSGSSSQTSRRTVLSQRPESRPWPRSSPNDLRGGRMQCRR